MKEVIHKFSRKILTVIYLLIGLLYTCTISIRIWQEGWFGEGSQVLFVAMEGPVAFLLQFSSALLLTAGQIIKLIGKNNGIWLSRISFILLIAYFFTYYCIHKQGYIWGYTFDFILFFLITVLFYIPIVFRSQLNPILIELYRIKQHDSSKK